jgi:hypothetical protein
LKHGPRSLGYMRAIGSFKPKSEMKVKSVIRDLCLVQQSPACSFMDKSAVKYVSQDPKDSELFASKLKPGETLVEGC